MRTHFLVKLFIFVLGFLDFPTDQPRTAHATLRLVHPLQRERIATVVTSFLLIDNFHVSHALHFFCPSIIRPLLVNPRAIDTSMFLQALWDSRLPLGAGPAQCRFPTLIAPSKVVCCLMPLKMATTSDAGYSDACSDSPVMRTCLRSCFQRPSPRGTSAVSLELVGHLVSFLTNSPLLFDLQAFMLQRYVGPTKLYTLGSLARD